MKDQSKFKYNFDGENYIIIVHKTIFYIITREN